MSQWSSREELPSGWVRTTLAELGQWRGGGTPSKSEKQLWRDGTIPWVSPKDMKVDIIEDAQDRLSEAARSHPSFKLAAAGSVLLVTRSSILQHTLPVAVTAREVAFNQDLKALLPRPGINPHYVALYLRAEADRFLEAVSKAGTTVESLDMPRLLAFPIRLAPTAEQGRIVAKLEPRLARCALVRTELNRVSRLVARHHRSTLLAAFQGALNQAPRNVDGQPLGWRTVPLSLLIDEGPSNGISPPTAVGISGTLSLRLTATTSGFMRLDHHAVKRVDITPPPGSKYWLRSGDLLVQRANAREHVGASAIFDGPAQTYIYPDLMMRIRLANDLTRRYVWRYLNSPAARAYFQDRATGSASTMPKITGSVLKSLPVPMPPPDQIATIVEAIDRRFERLAALIIENNRCSRLLDKLERAFLRRAFEGQLVEQRADEPSADKILAALQPQATQPSTKGQGKMTSSRIERGDDPRLYLQRQLEVWPSEGLTFEQLRGEAPGSYEELKDVVFELIEGKRLLQHYDARERRMKLVRPA